jgi:hypothetical protein
MAALIWAIRHYFPENTNAYSTKKTLGASLLGIECDEVIHSILDVMYATAPYTVIHRAMHIHLAPTNLLPSTFNHQLSTSVNHAR